MMNRLPQSFHPPGVTFLTDVSAARWVETGLSSNFAHVDALVPRGYAAYGRLFHPASGEDNRRVRWSEVAAWAGSVVHPLMAFEGISAPKPGHVAGARPWLQDPMEDQMDEQDALVLAVLLSGFTGTPQHCYFGIWDGFGQYSPGAMTLLTASGGIPQSPPLDVISAQRFDGVGREYLLYEGPLTAIGSFFNHFRSHPPNIWWPEDRSWCVATDIDLNTTYVGGSQACIQAIIGEQSLEALATSGDAPVYMAADAINLGAESA